MRQKVVKQLNKLAKALMLTRGERKKLKKDYKKTQNRNIDDLKSRVERVNSYNSASEEK